MSEHKPDCRWQRTTETECEYRVTHHYCPHPKHACDCPPPDRDTTAVRADVLKVRNDDPSLDRALRDCRFYVAILAAEKPERYETYQTAVDGTTVLLSRAIAVVLDRLESLTARAVRAEADAKRLDWLETKVVNVRESTRYGSMNLFWASPTDEDADTSCAPSDLRKQIDDANPRPATP